MLATTRRSSRIQQKLTTANKSSEIQQELATASRSSEIQQELATTSRRSKKHQKLAAATGSSVGKEEIDPDTTMVGWFAAVQCVHVKQVVYACPVEI